MFWWNVEQKKLSQDYQPVSTPSCWGRLVFLRPLPEIHTSYQYLEWFEAVFKIFACAVFEAIEAKGQLRLNFEGATSKFCSHFWKFGCQPQKSLYDKQFQSSDLFVVFIVPQRLNLVSIAKKKISKSNKSELWNRLSYKGLP